MRSRTPSRALLHHAAFEFGSGLRNRAMLLLLYLFPLGFFLIAGALMVGLNPGFRETLIQAMVVFALTAGCLLGLPDPIVASREAGIFRSFKIHGVPAANILLLPGAACRPAGYAATMCVSTTIDGCRVRLRPATLADRRTIHDWSYASDVALRLHLSDPPTRPLDDWCTDWEEHDFTDGEPERGHMFVVLDGAAPVGAIAFNDIDDRRRVELDTWLNAEANCGRGLGRGGPCRQRAHDPRGRAPPMTWSLLVDSGAGGGTA